MKRTLLSFLGLFGCALLLPACQTLPAEPSTAEEAYERALAHHEDGDAPDALWLYRWAAERGHYRAQLSLADYYRWGGLFVENGIVGGGDKDAERSEAWYRRAAETMADAPGDAEAAAQLGILYYYGYGVEQDVDKALALLRQAADAENGTAHFFLGWAASGTVGEEQARRHLMRAHELGEHEAIFFAHLPDLHEATAAEDARRVVEIYWHCIEEGSTKAAESLEEFLQGLRRAADEGNPDAVRHLDELKDAGLLPG